MGRSLSFRQKIFLSYFIVFLLFTSLLYPSLTYLLHIVQEQNLTRQTKQLIKEISSSPNLVALISALHEKQKVLFFRVTLLDSEQKSLFDSHEKAHENQEESPEVLEALQKGKGYVVRYSPLFDQDMAYVALPFSFQNKNYVLRAAFPYGQIRHLTEDFTLAFLLLGTTILLLFSLLAWLIIHFLTRPVQQIIAAIRPYQLGKVEHIPEIHLGREIGPKDEFGKLAQTLNSLSKRIEYQIATLTQARNEKMAILELLGEGVIAVDDEMTVIYINHTAESFLGFKKEELLGKNFSQAKFPECFQLICNAQSKGESLSLILKSELKPRRYLDVIVVPRGPEGAIVVLQDKTSLHKVIELGRDFIANASHELKTPITIIRGFAETLHDHPDLTREIFEEITEKIVSNCQRMDTLVKNLLTLAAIDEQLPRSRLHECDLLELSTQARQTILAVHPTAQITIETRGEPPYVLLADGDLLMQAVLNLLDNAAKYSKPPAQIHVTLDKKEREFAIIVADKGLGIPQEDLERIFERFYVVDKSHSRSMGGSGLGLSIVARIVEKHQGKIDVTSEIGKGTTFTLLLPIIDEEEF